MSPQTRGDFLFGKGIIMKFVLFEKLAELAAAEWLMIAIALVLAAALAAILIRLAKQRREDAPGRRIPARVLAQGALCLAIAFVLSYVKLFSMPLGGSVTLCSMLPVVLFGYLYGPAYGFTAAFAYSLLQIVQGAYVVHPVQFALDYLFAFTALGLGSLFPKSLPLGMAVSGLARMACSMLSGIVFFASYAYEAGYSSALWYSLIYNGSTVGVETALCVLVALLPPVKRAIAQIKRI